MNVHTEEPIMDMELRTEQKLALSARMIQSAEILQMTALDLSAYLNEAALENPVLDLTTPSALSSGSISYSADYGSGESDEEDESDDWKYKDIQEENLAEYLWSQLLTSGLSGKDMDTLHYMLYCLDERGYLEATTEELAQNCQRSQEEIRSLLSVLQNLDPAGVGARDLSECLLLQIRRLSISTPLLETLIASHLDAIAKNQLPALCNDLNCTMAELNQAIQVIRTLNPKPGMSYCDRRQLSYLTPDVTVVKFQDHYEILLSEFRYPEIHINDYYAHLARLTDDPEVQEYLGSKLRQAEWLRTCIAQRSQTILRITRAIVEFQRDFFAHGKHHLRPLRLIEVANAAGVHESTVSRAVRGKYLQCMWGIFPLNYFFPKGIFLERSHASSDAVPDVKQALQILIEQENKKKPYSDRMLAEQLTAQGYTISRRTIAKYRDLLEIGDASGRRVYE